MPVTKRKRTKKKKAAPKSRRREWEDSADLEWECNGITTKLFLLEKGDIFPLRSSGTYDHCESGPGLALVKISPSHTETHVRASVRDPETWAWIARLMRDGIKSYDDAAKMLTKVDREVA